MEFSYYCILRSLTVLENLVFLADCHEGRIDLQPQKKTDTDEEQVAV